MMTLQEAYTKQSELEDQIKELQSDLSDMKNNPQLWWDLDGQYNDMLDDCHDPVEIAGIEFSPSQILAECDPTAYRCCFSDYCSDYDVYSMPEYQDRESELEDLESELEELEEEIDELESEEEA
ncbi:MAG: hypothetical protein GOVbin4162_110 [Prokaryotic dsDNA virus sp.]|nr:MAG: hypothetical protein GOVbin4162_110 [Prokaryotic dsDNA virus sp.]|tara:strand:- start:2243 stop:2614 length:372 start_codon:yes stop_codon:yes gene_type:complete